MTTVVSEVGVDTKSDAAKERESSKKDSPMSPLINRIKGIPNLGDIVEGEVLSVNKGKVFVNLEPFGTGIIYGWEFIVARDIIKKINPGDKISAKIVDPENEEGYIELSLKEARQARVWGEAEVMLKEKTPVELQIKEANKGGLIVEWQGVTGFLPASQLKAEHYPRVPDGDKDKIFEELKKMIGTKIAMTVISVSPKENKLIFSEKTFEDKDKEKLVGKYAVGDQVEGEVTGIVDFGLFLKVEEGLEGLVHISEMDWGLVENPRTLFKVGDKIKAKIIEIKDGKISLSIKALKANPWVEAANKYKKDDAVKAVIIKFNRHGALASIEEGVAGLVHISEFGTEEKLHSALELGKTYDFKITLFDPAQQKMTLAFAGKK
ncbi:MAG TPA: S1 RNA-binding domain-containing protein [Candidatus Paceibacterota bacterium]